jgi:hypothetical protein
MLSNILTLLVIVAVIAGACIKLFIDKKNGIQCPGCPYSKMGNQICNCSDPTACKN